MINELLRRRILGLTGDAATLPPERMEADQQAMDSLSELTLGKGVLSNRDVAMAEQLMNPAQTGQISDQQLQEQIEMARRMMRDQAGKGVLSNRDMEMLTPVQQYQQYQKQMEMLESTMPMRPSMQSMPMEMPNMPSDLDPLDEMDEETKQELENLLGKSKQKIQAPLAPLATQLAMAGEGEDTTLAHLRPGEVVIPPEFMEDDAFEDALEKKFKEFNINPEQAVVGAGIANLNPQTGLEQFGFFKKLGKKLKKVVKKVAPIAAFIPGVGTALGGVLGGIGGLATKIPVIGGTLGKIGTAVSSGIAGLGIPGISSIAGGATQGFGGILPGLQNPLAGGIFGQTGSTFAGGPAAGQGLANQFGLGSGTPGQVAAYNQAQQAQAALNSMTPAQIAANPQQYQQLQQLAAGSGGGMFSRMTGGGGGIGGTGGGGGGGFLGGLGQALKVGGIGALAAGLGKLAYEDAKKQTGVPLTPLTTMSPTGRYNIEAEIARRMGQPTPNPVEFGLLPANTFPELSGGKPAGMSLGGAIEELQGGMARGMMGGGIMAYAQGGAVAMQEGGGIDSLSQDKINKYLDELSQKKQDMFFHNKFPTTLVSKQKFKTAKENYDNAARYVTPENLAKYEEGGMDAISSKAAKKSLKKYLNSINAKKMSEGGGMDPSQFPRMDGDINGPGTETSDDIPAMLSDGEFVMTGQAVRGAGSYDMQKNSEGIISLTPSFDEDRERGMDLMYKMMDTFAGEAKPS